MFGPTWSRKTTIDDPEYVHRLEKLPSIVVVVVRGLMKHDDVLGGRLARHAVGVLQLLVPRRDSREVREISVVRALEECSRESLRTHRHLTAQFNEKSVEPK